MPKLVNYDAKTGDVIRLNDGQVGWTLVTVVETFPNMINAQYPDGNQLTLPYDSIKSMLGYYLRAETDYNVLREALDRHGDVLGYIECNIRYVRIGGEVWCQRSHTQMDWCGTVDEWSAAIKKRGIRLRMEPLPYPD
jgi:hypothetical protein